METTGRGMRLKAHTDGQTHESPPVGIMLCLSGPAGGGNFVNSRGLWVATDDGCVNDGDFRPFQGGLQLAPDGRGAGHTDSAGTEGAGEIVEGDGAEGTGDRFAELAHVAGASDAPTPVVGDDGDEGEMLAHGAFDVGQVEGEGAVAGQENHRAAGKRQPGRHGTADSP